MSSILRWILAPIIGVAIAQAPIIPLNSATTVANAVITGIPHIEAIITPPPQIGDIWANYPLLERICSCESTGHPDRLPRQFYANGDILWGQDGGVFIKRDVGACQINTFAHATELKALGLDVIHSLVDNVKFAKILYNRNGTRDWVASEGCWKTDTNGI